MTGSYCLTDFQACLSSPPILLFAWESRACLPRVLSVLFLVVLFSNQRLSLEKRLGFWLFCFGLVDLGLGVDRQLILILFICSHQGL